MVEKERICQEEGCTTIIKRLRETKKVQGKLICVSCYKQRRIQRREKLIEEDKILQEDIKVINDKERERKRERNKEYNKRYYERAKREGKIILKGRPRPKAYIPLPVPKGSKIKLKKEKSYTYLTLKDRQNLLRLFMRQGMDFEEAKIRVQDIAKEQTRIRNIMKEKGKEEKEIKEKMNIMLEELWKQ